MELIYIFITIILFLFGSMLKTINYRTFHFKGYILTTIDLFANGLADKSTTRSIISNKFIRLYKSTDHESDESRNDKNKKFDYSQYLYYHFKRPQIFNHNRFSHHSNFCYLYGCMENNIRCIGQQQKRDYELAIQDPDCYKHHMICKNYNGHSCEIIQNQHQHQYYNDHQPIISNIKNRTITHYYREMVSKPIMGVSIIQRCIY